MCNINGNTRGYILGIYGVFSMKAEKLKVIAEGMGYKIAYIVNDWVMCEAMGGMIFNYTPHLTNNDQLVEIMEKLGLDVIYDQGIWKSGRDTANYYGKTISEAVCNAAYEYFKCQ